MQTTIVSLALTPALAAAATAAPVRFTATGHVYRDDFVAFVDTFFTGC